MSQKQIKPTNVTRKKAVTGSSISNSTSAIIEKLSQKSSVEYKPYDSLKGRYVKLDIKK